jgi:nitrogen regulatory protein P-II 1
MKQIATIIQPGMVEQVVKAIKKAGVGGITVLHAQGQGEADAPLVGQYFSKELIVTVVDDSKVEDVLNSIAQTACTGTKGDGKVFVYNVEQISS